MAHRALGLDTPEGILAIACAHKWQAAQCAEERLGSPVADKTMGTFPSQKKGHEDASGQATSSHKTVVLRRCVTCCRSATTTGPVYHLRLSSLCRRSKSWRPLRIENPTAPFMGLCILFTGVHNSHSPVVRALHEALQGFTRCSEQRDGSSTAHVRSILRPLALVAAAGLACISPPQGCQESLRVGTRARVHRQRVRAKGWVLRVSRVSSNPRPLREQR